MKYTLNIIVLFCSLIALFSCNEKQAPKDSYTILLNLKGFKDNTKFKIWNIDKGLIIDSISLKNGKAKFNGKIETPFVASIETIDDKYLNIWLEQGKTNVIGDYDNFFYSEINGTPLNEVMVKYRNQQAKLEMRRDSLFQKVLKLISSENDRKEANELNKKVKKIDIDITNLRINSINTEEPSYYTLEELYFLRNDLSKDSLKMFFNKFSGVYKETKYGKVISTYLENKPINIGDNYIDIEAKNNLNKVVKLSELKGNYILLDFWASWCGPCRQENSNLLRLYKKYNKKGFEIYSFSTDNNKESWEKAVKKDSIFWTSVIDENGSYSTMSALYNVRAIPTSFLINPEGKIISKNLRGQELDDKLKSEMNKNGL